MKNASLSSSIAVKKISVCICTYKRPELLRRSLAGLVGQDTHGESIFDIVVADNDREESGRSVVAEFRATSPLEITYCVEPEQNIALARNRALQNADGEFVAFIDDDEFPAADWLVTMFKACEAPGVAGVLGPVRPFFDQPPPDWLLRGRFCERPEYPTGTLLHWRQTRTGNVLFKRDILLGVPEPFRREFGNGGEDQDFFRAMVERDHRFIWCNEAVVYEVVPPERWRRRYYLKRALLRGQNEKLLLNFPSLAKSLVAVPLYALSLPVLLLLGQHLFMRSLIRLLDHAGKLLAAIGLRPVQGKYLNG